MVTSNTSAARVTIAWRRRRRAWDNVQTVCLGRLRQSVGNEDQVEIPKWDVALPSYLGPRRTSSEHPTLSGLARRAIGEVFGGEWRAEGSSGRRSRPERIQIPGSIVESIWRREAWTGSL